MPSCIASNRSSKKRLLVADRPTAHFGGIANDPGLFNPTARGTFSRFSPPICDFGHIVTFYDIRIRPDTSTPSRSTVPAVVKIGASHHCHSVSPLIGASYRYGFRATFVHYSVAFSLLKKAGQLLRVENYIFRIHPPKIFAFPTGKIPLKIDGAFRTSLRRWSG